MNKNFKFILEHQVVKKRLKNLFDKKFFIIPILNKKKKLINLIKLDQENMIYPNNLAFIIMAGGRGSRLGSITNNLPKGLVRINNKPILELILERLKKYGISNIYISINYLGDQIQRYFGNGKKLGLNIRYIREKKPMGTIGSLSRLKKKYESYMVVNCDLYNQINFKSIIEKHLFTKAEFTIGYSNNKYFVPYGVLELKRKNVIRILEKPYYEYSICAGVNIFSHKIKKLIPKNKKFDLPDLINKCLLAKIKLSSHLIYEDLLDIGTLENLEKAKNL